MNNKEFDKVVAVRIERIKKSLQSKGKEYALTSDRLKNFKSASLLLSQSPEKALLGYLTKHIVSIYDMVEYDTDINSLDGLLSLSSLAQFNEKIGDAINYLILLEALLIERAKINDNN